MGRRGAGLNDRTIKTARPREKAYKLADGGGLYLEVSPAGSKLWRYKLRFEGKEKRLALGQYPDVTLAMARERHLDARRLLAQGIDPTAAKRAERVAASGALSFEAVTREWHRRRPEVRDEKSEALNIRRFENHVFPHIGKLRIDEVKPPHLRDVLLRVEASGKAELAHRIRTLLGQVIRYAHQLGYRSDDIGGSMRGVLTPVTVKHHAAVTEPRPFGHLLRAIDGYDGEPVVRAALRLAPLVFVRPGELVRMRWAEVDFEARQWRFITSKTKTDLTVPLSRQAIAVLEEVRPLTWGHELVFHSLRSKSKLLSDNTLNAALRYCGIDTRTTQCAHGFRSSARTMLEEHLGYRYEVVELQLGHMVPDMHGRAYNRTHHLETRTRMMQQWADFLDEQKAAAAAVVVDMTAHRAKVG